MNAKESSDPPSTLPLFHFSTSPLFHFSLSPQSGIVALTHSSGEFLNTEPPLALAFVCFVYFVVQTIPQPPTVVCTWNDSASLPLCTLYTFYKAKNLSSPFPVPSKTQMPPLALQRRNLVQYPSMKAARPESPGCGGIVLALSDEKRFPSLLFW